MPVIIFILCLFVPISFATAGTTCVSASMTASVKVQNVYRASTAEEEYKSCLSKTRQVPCQYLEDGTILIQNGDSLTILEPAQLTKKPQE